MIEQTKESTKMNTEKVLNHLREKWGSKECAQCGANNWSVTDKVFELREFQGGSLIVGNSPIIPVVPVCCTNCGNTILVNAMVSGALENTNSEQNNP